MQASLEFSSCADAQQEEQEKPLMYQPANALRVRDWSNLPRDIRNTIADKISFFPHLQKFGAACKEWNEITSQMITPDAMKNHPPMMLLPYNNKTQTCTFLEMEHCERYYLKVPEFQGCRFCGMSNGWLAMIDTNMHLSFFNLVTRALVNHPVALPVIRYRVKLRKYRLSVIRVVLSGDPSSFDCMVAVISGIHQRLAVCRMGEGQWNVATSDPTGISTLERFKYYEDVVFFQGKIYAATRYKELSVFDYCDNLSILDTVPPPHDHFLGDDWISRMPHLAESCGQLFFIRRYGKWMQDYKRRWSVDTWGFEVYRLEEGLAGRTWSRVSTLEGRSLLLGPNDTISISAFSWCPPNCIYFTHDDYDCKGQQWVNEVHKGYQWDNGVYSLEENRVIIVYDIEHSLTFWPTAALWYCPKL